MDTDNHKAKHQSESESEPELIIILTTLHELFLFFSKLPIESF